MDLFEMIHAVKGTKDILPENIGLWQFIEERFRFVSSLYSYFELRTPVFEKTEVFARGIGETTDIVNKEMYSFIDKGGEHITLRPELTAPMVRSVIQNNLLEQSQLLKLWYFGPLMRYERPQKGRLRQFHQYGAECMGSLNPESDVELLLLANSLCKSVGIDDYKLLLNSLGNDESRSKYRAELISYLSRFKNDLSEESKYRLDKNPLRVLDSKHQADVEIIANAPDIKQCFDSESLEHFAFVTNSLDSLGIKYEISPKLVRGLDYYCHTVFEFQSGSLGAQDSFGGGGRYNKLFEELGGKPTPAVGFAFGIERIIIILESIGKALFNNNSTDVTIICQSPVFFSYTMQIAEILRTCNYRVNTDLLRRSIKSQMREANKLNSRFVFIVGDDEFGSGTVMVKDMSDSSQKKISIEQVKDFTI